MKKLTIAVLLNLIIILNGYSDDGLYDFKWLDEGEKVYVIQNKEHVKAGGLAVDLLFVDSDSSPYQDTTGLVFALTYYFSEKWSIDVTYKQYNNKSSADMENLLSAYSTEQIKPLIRKIDNAKLVHINWIPFYGKINTFNSIFFFDWGVGFGVGQYETQGNWETFNNKNQKFTFEKSQDSGFNFRSFGKFYTRSGMTFSLEYNLSAVNTIRDPNGKEDLLYYADLMAGIGYIF